MMTTTKSLTAQIETLSNEADRLIGMAASPDPLTADVTRLVARDSARHMLRRMADIVAAHRVPHKAQWKEIIEARFAALG